MSGGPDAPVALAAGARIGGQVSHVAVPQVRLRGFRRVVPACRVTRGEGGSPW